MPSSVTLSRGDAARLLVAYTSGDIAQVRRYFFFSSKSRGVLYLFLFVEWGACLAFVLGGLLGVIYGVVIFLFLSPV